ncbi:nuclear factor ovary-like protein [Labeo rohita]|uniref:Nuclear factor ovary-like protein n=1 Tax=Labeo rohita TaxID=84645 RepID=A0A498MQA4_LABRO|nr:nuclear factor ovary-like protein [Labeo rohita]
MATSKNKTSLREDLTCAICFELFKDPVMLGCMHHFCRKCIVSYWKTVRGPVCCPQCRQEFPNKCFQTNYLVAGLVEKVRASSTSASVKYLEKQLKDRLESQVSMKEAYATMIREDKDKMEKIKKMGDELQGRVHSDFQALHHFLRVEEEAMLEELKREQEEMLQRLERHLEALQVAIRDVEQNINMLQQTASSTEQSVLVECVNILATEGFQSGRHYWEVDVSNNPKWDLGVALESVNRQVIVKLCPENGYWTLRLRNGSQYSAGTQPWTPVTVMTSPSRVGVFLDCEERKVSFYNADNMALLYSFSSGPRGKAFPFFSTCLSERGQKAQAIRILHFPFECPSEM